MADKQIVEQSKDGLLRSSGSRTIEVSESKLTEAAGV